MMKQTRYNKLKHPVRFVRVLNQPATWIEIEVVEKVTSPGRKAARSSGPHKQEPGL